MENFPDPAQMNKQELIDAITYHNRRYWELGEPEIPDALYDQLIEALRRFDSEHPLLQQVNAPSVAGNGKVIHREPMLSLDKAYTLQELLDWGQKFARTPEEMLLVEPKYDGISALYDGAVLSTRGDGAVGEDISDKLPLIELEAPGYRGKLDRHARGEIVIRDDDFQNLYSHIRRKDGGTYKNQRNAVAGIMGLKEIDLMLAQHAKLTLVDYNLLSIAVPLNELEAKWEELEAQLTELPYPQDGIVLKFADEKFRKSLGATAHHPRGEIAYKFSNLRRESVLLGVEWSFGKNCLTPVALLEPVEISGTTIKRATLHNVQNIKELDLMIGDHVTVERAGDVIPHIVSCTPGEHRKSPYITACPSCHAALQQVGPELICPNPECPGTGLQRLAAAVRALEIDNLGESTLKKLVEHCGVRHLGDLFKLQVIDVLKLEGFAAKSASNLIAELKKARHIKDYQLLASLNIPNVGANIARLLLKEHSFAELRTLSADALAEIPGIGPERAASLTTAFAEDASYIDELLSAVELESESAGAELPTVCFTGKMPEKRSYYEKLAQQHGFRAVGAVTSSLSVLVAQDPTATGGKLTNARKLGVKIVALDDFLRELEQNAAPEAEIAPGEQGSLF